LLIPLLEAGLHVEGIDASEVMLAYCRKHCADRGLDPILYQGNMETLDLPGKFSAIVVTWGSFMLLEKRQNAITALQAFARHLEPNGRIFIDLEIPIEDLKTQAKVRQSSPMECKEGSLITMQVNSLPLSCSIFLCIGLVGMNLSCFCEKTALKILLYVQTTRMI